MKGSNRHWKIQGITGVYQLCPMFFFCFFLFEIVPLLKVNYNYKHKLEFYP